MQTGFKLYKVDMKYICNLHNIDDKVLSVSIIIGFPLYITLRQTGSCLEVNSKNYLAIFFQCIFVKSKNFFAPT